MTPQPKRCTSRWQERPGLRQLRRSFVGLAIFLGGVARCPGDSSEQAQQFLQVPQAIWSYDPPGQKFLTASLPAGLLEMLRKYDWGDDSALPKNLYGYILDLDGDGQVEYFIRTIHGGTAGRAYLVLTLSPKGWRIIGDFQGWFYLVHAGNDWLGIVVCSRGGMESFRKALLRFCDGQYVETSVERFENGEITKAGSSRTPL